MGEEYGMLQFTYSILIVFEFLNTWGSTKYCASIGMNMLSEHYFCF